MHDETVGLTRQLQTLIKAIETTNRVILSGTNLALLQSIVEAAARIFNAAAAAIAFVTEDGQELEFKVAYNVIDQNIIGMRFPVHEGIAGYAVLTGEPVTVSSADADERFNRRFAEQSGYIPQSILAVPLLKEGETIGVIEVLDKYQAQAFGLEDIELLTIFAHQVALAIGQSQRLTQLQANLLAQLQALVASDAGASQNGITASAALIQLAEQIRDLSALGEAERTVCAEVLHVFQRYPLHNSSEGVMGGHTL